LKAEADPALKGAVLGLQQTQDGVSAKQATF
jgi:hypothetical protein